MKVYLVLLDEVYDGETQDCTAFVYDNREKAEKKLKELHKLGKDTSSFDTDGSVVGDYVDLYTAGYYSRNHFMARIEEREVE